MYIDVYVYIDIYTVMHTYIFVCVSVHVNIYLLHITWSGTHRAVHYLPVSYIRTCIHITRMYMYIHIYTYAYTYSYITCSGIASRRSSFAASAAPQSSGEPSKKWIWRDNSPAIGSAGTLPTHRLMNGTYVATAPPKVLLPAALDRSSEGQLAAFHQSWQQPQSPSHSVVHRGESETLHARSPSHGIVQQSESVVAGEFSQQAHRKGELTSWDRDKKAMYGPPGELDRKTPNEGR